MSNPLWAYSLQTYGREGVASSALILQDAFNMDVNLLLYAAWLSQSQQGLDDEHLTKLEAQVCEWRVEVVQPLRELRRQLRSLTQAVAVREQIKNLELSAEQEQQDVMFAFHQRTGVLSLEGDSLYSNLEKVALLASPADRSWEAELRRLASFIAD